MTNLNIIVLVSIDQYFFENTIYLPMEVSYAIQFMNLSNLVNLHYLVPIT